MKANPIPNLVRTWTVKERKIVSILIFSFSYYSTLLRYILKASWFPSMFLDFSHVLCFSATLFNSVLPLRLLYDTIVSLYPPLWLGCASSRACLTRLCLSSRFSHSVVPPRPLWLFVPLFSPWLFCCDCFPFLFDFIMSFHSNTTRKWASPLLFCSSSVFSFCAPLPLWWLASFSALSQRSSQLLPVSHRCFLCGFVQYLLISFAVSSYFQNFPVRHWGTSIFGTHKS